MKLAGPHAQDYAERPCSHFKPVAEVLETH
jgi:hypothetical protein